MKLPIAAKMPLKAAQDPVNLITAEICVVGPQFYINPLYRVLNPLSEDSRHPVMNTVAHTPEVIVYDSWRYKENFKDLAVFQAFIEFPLIVFSFATAAISVTTTPGLKKEGSVPTQQLTW